LNDNYGKGSIGEIPNELTKGEIIPDYSKLYFLTALLNTANKPEFNDLGLKIINVAEDYKDKAKDKLDIHFYYQFKLKFYYRNREINNNLEKAIEACEEQIKFADIAKKAFLKEFNDTELPSHAGYKQLVIIKEKQKKFEEAISLCKKANEQGWNGDWEHRIEKLTKRINKQ
jgi:hypothetical protein